MVSLSSECCRRHFTTRGYIADDTTTRARAHARIIHFVFVVMPRGSTKKHSKQAGTLGSEALTHSERKALGYGTVKERLGKETVKDYDACALTLTSAKDAVVTPEGVVYDRGAILECLVSQKLEYERKLRAYERALEGEARDAEDRANKKRKIEIEAFHAANHHGGATTTTTGAGEGAGSRKSVGDGPAGKDYAGAASSHSIDFNAKRIAEMPTFWQIDGGVDDGLKHAVKKPEKETKCPTTMKKLRMKDLVAVKWTKVRAGESGKHMCPITFKTFTNATSIVVLKPTGDALSEEGYKTVVEGEGAYNGTPIRPNKDVIRLQKGGTGFAGSGTQVESKVEFEMGVGGTGALRGQNRGAQSKFGLRFT